MLRYSYSIPKVVPGRRVSYIRGKRAPKLNRTKKICINIQQRCRYHDLVLEDTLKQAVYYKEIQYTGTLPTF